MFKFVHNSLSHVIFEHVDEFLGLKTGVGWSKHFVHGLHWVHIKSLPVSIMAENGFAGVPMERFIKNSPSPARTGAVMLLTAGGIVANAASFCSRFLLRWIAR